jgi:hypothetical protein
VPKRTTTTRVQIGSTTSTTGAVTGTTAQNTFPSVVTSSTSTLPPPTTTIPPTTTTTKPPPTPIELAQLAANSTQQRVNERQTFNARFDNCLVYYADGPNGERVSLSDPERIVVTALGRTVTYLASYRIGKSPILVPPPNTSVISSDNTGYKVTSVNSINGSNNPLPYCGENIERTVIPRKDSDTHA